jgi:hypothetical protein
MDYIESECLRKDSKLIPLVPTTPKQKFASRLMEFISEEWIFQVGFAQRLVP